MSKNKTIKPNKERVLFKDRQHLDWPDKQKTGTEGQSLSEEGIIPKYFQRPGDAVITPKTLKMGNDNNTMIIMGRDRNGLGEMKGKDASVSESGFGHHMGAGAIDIVVGRMAPFPVASFYGDPKNQPLSVGPIFKTKDYRKLASTGEKSPLLGVPIYNFKETVNMSEESQAPQSTAVLTGSHPGVVMDAARIYISQMTNLDDYFSIKKDIFTFGGKEDKPRPSTPSSGIMIKADEIRLHSRKDLKIVTGGLNETVDSQGNEITFNPRIHLLAGNGKNPQHPIPLGNNLIKLFEELFTTLEDYVNNMNTFVTQQIKFNSTVAGHVHTELGATGMPCLPSLLTMKFGAETTYFHLANNVIGGGLAIGTQIQNLRRYVNSGGDNSEYINSRYVTTS